MYLFTVTNIILHTSVNVLCDLFADFSSGESKEKKGVRGMSGKKVRPEKLSTFLCSLPFL